VAPSCEHVESGTRHVSPWHISEELIRGGNVRLLGESGHPSERKRTKKRKGMRSEQGNAGESSQSLMGLALIMEYYQR
jgi:hypothetical protein